MFIFYDCLWKLSIAVLSVTFAAFRVIEYLSIDVMDETVTNHLAYYSQYIHILSALLFVISILTRNTPITILTIATIICQSVFTYNHYFSRECISHDISFTGNAPCSSEQVQKYFSTFHRELFCIYMVAVTSVICILCISLYVNHLERVIEKTPVRISEMCDPSDGSSDQPKTSVVSMPSVWSGKNQREYIVVRSQRHDSGTFSV